MGGPDGPHATRVVRQDLTVLTDGTELTRTLRPVARTMRPATRILRPLAVPSDPFPVEQHPQPGQVMAIRLEFLPELA